MRTCGWAILGDFSEHAQHRVIEAYRIEPLGGTRVDKMDLWVGRGGLRREARAVLAMGLACCCLLILGKCQC